MAKRGAVTEESMFPNISGTKLFMETLWKMANKDWHWGQMFMTCLRESDTATCQQQ